MIKVIILIVISLLLSSQLWAGGPGTTSANFLKAGQGVRPIAMGESYTALGDDIDTLYWNPAGISRLSRGEILFEYTDWLVDIRLNYIGTVIPLGRFGSIGAFLTSLNMPRMKVRTMEYPDGTGEYFNSSDLSFQTPFHQFLLILQDFHNKSQVEDHIFHLILQNL